MAENDIYNSRTKYDRFLLNLNELLEEPQGKRKYQCKVPANLAYFDRLARKFGAKDLSFVRRLRLMNSLKLIVHVADKDLKDCSREDVDRILAFMYKVNKSPKSQSDFCRDIRFLWRLMLPEKDEKGRPDETIMPYAVRHVNGRQDISKQKARKDKLSVDEFQKIVSHFGGDAKMQAFLAVAAESLSRPQELLYCRVKDVDLQDGWGKISVSWHGKEGTKLLQVLDSWPYLSRWLEEHPQKDNPEAWLFPNSNAPDRSGMMKPFSINKRLKAACRVLGIKKDITCYSLKRAAITWACMRGESPQSIQMRAGWRSTKQLQTYNHTTQQDELMLRAIRAGRIKDPDTLNRYKGLMGKDSVLASRMCICGAHIGFEESFCHACKRPTDPEKTLEGQIQRNTRLEQEMAQIKQTLKDYECVLEFVRKKMETTGES